MVWLTIRLSWASAAAICSGWVSHNRVEPSTSASSSVTVPVGSNSLMPKSFQVSSTFWLMLARFAARAAHYTGAIAQKHRPRRVDVGIGSAPDHIDWPSPMTGVAV